MKNLQITPTNLLEGRSFRKGKFFIATSNCKTKAVSYQWGGFCFVRGISRDIA